jgi:preprotein translocase subunit SecG
MWWIYILLGIYVLTCVILVVTVLLQPGKADAAALFGGGASQTAFGPRGTQNFLGWTTWIAAAVMIVLALIFSLPGMFGPRSVVQGGAVPIEQPGPASQPPSPAPQSKAPAASPAPSSQPAPSAPQPK